MEKAPRKITTHAGHGEEELKLRWFHAGRLRDWNLAVGWLFFGLLWAGFLGGMGGGALAQGNWLTGSALLLLALPGIVLLLRALAQISNATRICVARDGVRVSKGPLWIGGGVRKTLSARPGVQLVEQKHRAPRSSWTVYDVLLFPPADVPATIVSGTRSRQEAEFVKDWLERRLEKYLVPRKDETGEAGQA